MATVLNNVTGMPHKIRVKLYPSYLERKIPGKCLARTDSGAAATIEQIRMSAKNRGGFSGGLDDMIKHVCRFFHEAAYLLCDAIYGAVSPLSLLRFLIYPKAGGTFDKKAEGVSACGEWRMACFGDGAFLSLSILHLSFSIRAKRTRNGEGEQTMVLSA